VTVLRASLRNLAAHRFRTVATAATVALGVAFLAGTLVLADTVRLALDRAFAHSYTGTDVHVRGAATFSTWLGDERPRLEAGLVAAVASVEGVAAAEGRIEGYAQLLDRHGDPVGDSGRAVGAGWSRLDGANPFRLVRGRAPAGDGEIVIDRASAKAAGYGIGDRVRVATNAGSSSVTVVGIATFGTADAGAASSYVLFDQGAAERLVARPGRVDSIVAVAGPGVGAPELRDRIAAALGDRVEVLTTAELLAEKRATSAGVTNAIRTLLLAFAAVALFVAAFIIQNTFSILVAQRTREVGLLRALGAMPRQVVASVLVEASVLGLAGGILGVFAGVAVAAALRGLVANLGFEIPGGELAVRGASLVVPVVVGLFVTASAAAFPARRAAAVPPMAALRAASVDTSGRSGRRAIGGMALVAAGTVLAFGPIVAGSEQPAVIGLGAAAFFSGLAVLGPLLVPLAVGVIGSPLARVAGVTLELARQSALRNARRTAGAAASLMIGVGLVTLISVFASSAKATVSRPWGGRPAVSPDYVIQPADPDAPGFSPELADRLGQLPEVGMVAAARAAMAQVGTDPPVHVHGVDPTVWAAMSDDGTVEGDATRLGDGDISVLESLARAKGWAVGGLVTLRFADTGDRSFRITSTRASGPPFLVGLAAYEASVADQLDTKILVKKAESVSTDAAEAAIRAVVRDYPAATLLDQRGKSPEQLAGIERFANAVYVMLGLALVIAVLGIGTTLSLSVVERTPELGLLRAVGMTPGQARAMVRWESALIALFGAGLGTLVGLCFGWAILHGLPDRVAFRVPVVPVVVVTAISAVAALAAAAGPARRAARLDVLAAISRP
jgi:putative ABC transport system permease protein